MHCATIGSVMSYDDVCAWTKTFDLITNRISIVNQTLGARYDNSPDNPCSLVSNRGRYEIRLCGVTFDTFAAYDYDAISKALNRVDALADGLWYIMRSDKFTNYQLTMG